MAKEINEEKQMIIAVTKSNYESFLKQHRDELFVDVCGISEPPSINHYSKETEKLVAHTFHYDNDPDSCCYTPEEKREYYIDTENLK